MTSCEAEGFIAGYRSKEANGVDPTGLLGLPAKAIETLLKFILPVIFLAPAVVGGTVGMVHSKMTSPSKMDISSAQKALELSELQEFGTELKRRREAGTRQGKKEKSDARTLRL